MRFDASNLSLNLRETRLLKKLTEEYTDDIARLVLRPLIVQKSPVSLRALDWAVVNWSKQHNVVCSSLVPGEMTNVHHSYRVALTHWRRRLFDPFRRRERIKVHIDGEALETTLGQANFALWSYQTGVLAYVLSHVESIERDMNRVSRRQKLLRSHALQQGVRRHRRELIPHNGTACIAYKARTTATF